MLAFFILSAVMTSDLTHTELDHTVLPTISILITSLHLQLGTGICFFSCEFLLSIVCISCYAMRFIHRTPSPRFSTVRKNPKGNWRLRTTYSESTHKSIPAASPLRKTPSVYGIGAYGKRIPKPVRSSGKISI